MNNAIIYLISGLGADEKVFSHLNFYPYQTYCLKWLEPNNNDTIESYAQKLIAQIDQTKPVILIGVSMGGILAKEIKKHIHAHTCIIISSIQCASQFSISIKLARYLPLHRLLPVSFLMALNKLSATYFFSVSNPVQKRALQQTIARTDLVFLKWALKALIDWRDEVEDVSLLHIHGTRDRIFPTAYIHTPYVPIAHGGHWMIVNRSKEIEQIILNHLNLIHLK